MIRAIGENEGAGYSRGMLKKEKVDISKVGGDKILE
jgi:hypothetical protein